MAAAASLLPSYGRTTKHSRNQSSTASSSQSRSRFAKALPAPPPFLGKILPSRSSPAVVDTAPPSLQLPAASSSFLSSPGFSYIPTTAGPSSATEPPRHVPDTRPSTHRPLSKQLPPPPRPERQHPPPTRPIRRRPLAAASPLSNDTTMQSTISATDIPPAEASFALPALPQTPERPFPTQADTELPSKLTRPAPLTSVEPSSRVTSISSILSAYSQDSLDATGTNTSSYTAPSSSPLHSLPEESRGLTDAGKLENEILAPLSYLLEDSYLDDDLDDEEAQGDRAGTVTPPPPNKGVSVPPPRSTSLHHPAMDAYAKGASGLETPTPIWTRRAQRFEKPLRAPELDLAPEASAEHKINVFQRDPSVVPLKGPSDAVPPRPPPQGPLSHPPDRTDLGKTSASPAPQPRLGLPGRNIRPSQRKQALVSSTSVDASPAMGSSLSTLEAKVEAKLKRSHVPTPPSAPPLIGRLPTPSYDNDDEAIKNQRGRPTGLQTGASLAGAGADTSSSASTVVNVPMSPAASPEGWPGTFPSAMFLRDVALIDTPRTTPPPPSLPSGLVGRNIRPMKSVSQESPPGITLQQSQPFSRTQQAQQTQQPFAPRTSSHKPQASNIVQGQSTQLMPTEQQDNAWQNDNSVSRFKAMPGPETATDDVTATSSIRPIFPTGYMTGLVTAATVFAAPGLTAIQIDCFQQHRDMYRDRNANYPLSCQTCQVFERSARWRCKWCSVRVCTGCRDALMGPCERDLRRLKVYLADRGLLSEVPPVSKEVPLTEPAPVPVSEGGKLWQAYPATSMNELPVIREA